MGGYGIVGGNLPLAGGMGLASDYKGTEEVTVCVFGDGAANQGTFGETLNLAALWRLPIVFMVTNNQFGMGTSLERHSALTDLHRRGEGFGVPGMRCDGMDVVDTHHVLREAIRRAREERQPVLVEAVTYRFRGHSMADPEEYRSKEQVAEWRKRDPVRRPSPTDWSPRSGWRRRARADRRGDRHAHRRGGGVRRPLPVPAPGVAVRLDLRARRPGQGLVLGRRALRRRAPRGARACDRRRARPEGARPGAGEQRGRGYDKARVEQAIPKERTSDGRHALPRGAQPGAARGDAARRERAADGRGHRRLQRRLQGHERAARGVRREARARHADLREHHRRHGRRRRHDRPAARGRADDDQLLAAGDGPDRQPRRHDPLHVRRPGAGAAGDPDAAGRRRTSSARRTRTPSRRSTLTCPGCSSPCPPPRPTPRAC